MIGRRIEHLDDNSFEGIEPGDYWKDSRGHWHVASPVPRDEDMFLLTADISTWQITEHDDGTITVHPSIFWNPAGGNSSSEWQAKHTWHGFLEHGEWRQV